MLCENCLTTVPDDTGICPVCGSQLYGSKDIVPPSKADNANAAAALEAENVSLEETVVPKSEIPAKVIDEKKMETPKTEKTLGKASPKNQPWSISTVIIVAIAFIMAIMLLVMLLNL